MQGKLYAAEVALTSAHRDLATCQQRVQQCELREADAQHVIQTLKKLEALPRTAQLTQEDRDTIEEGHRLKAEYTLKLKELASAKDQLIGMQAEFERRVSASETMLQSRLELCKRRESELEQLMTDTAHLRTPVTTVST
jgi:hypothetical protein